MLHRLAPYLILLCVAACTSGNIGLSTISEITDNGEAAVDSRTLDPSLEYLRVVTQGRVILLVLGYVDRDPQGNVESWYSAKGEVIKLQRGRIVGTVGLATDWRAVRLPSIPRWAELPVDGFDYTRERDEMPGYRFGIRDRVRVRQTKAPDDSTLKKITPESLMWFEEIVIEPLAAPDNRPSRFAVQPMLDGDTVIYAEQCITPDLCIAWQKWPAIISRDAKLSQSSQ